MRRKEILAIVSIAIVLYLIAFFPIVNFDFGPDFKLLQTEQEVMEILILSRGFVSGNPHYEPQNVTAKVGTLIIWINGDLVHHTVTSDEGIQGKLEGHVFDSGPIPPRSEFLLETSRMLDDVYTYHCTIHPWTRGSLTLVTEPISVATEKPVYSMGEEVKVYGIASIPTGSVDASPTVPKKLENETLAKSVSLQVLGPSNKEFLSKELPVLGEGRYSHTFTAGEPGQYTVNVEFSGLTASTIFRVAPLPEERMATSAIEFEDMGGLPIATGKAGELVFIKTPVKNLLQIHQDYVYIVQVKDADQITMFLGWRELSIAPLGVSTPVISWIPEHEGTYSVEVFIWKDMDSPEPLSTNVERATLIALP